jgi:hypothetical protein
MSDQVPEASKEMLSTFFDPDYWPICMKQIKGVECRTPYVKRRAMLIAGGWTWAWLRDCKHHAKVNEIKVQHRDGQIK